GDRRDRVPERLPPRPTARRPRRRTRPADTRPVDRPRARLDGRRVDGRDANAFGRRSGRAMGVPGGRHDRGRKIRRPRLQEARMSYTLIGRVQSRAVSALPALLVALGLQRWWAIELVALMLGIGLVLDVVAYDRLITYQPA